MQNGLTPGKRFATSHEALKAYWGYDGFRGIQEQIIESVLAGSDTLALMPTGGGKSLCYQVPALVKPGVCIVISPLIALMKDQVQNLKGRGIRAAALFAGLSRREQEAIYDRAQFGGLDLLYLSPERLLTPWARQRLQQTEVSLIAVDEAHCISQWGHDFRPAYRQIAEIRTFLPQVPILALTATATPQVADDIVQQLEFNLGGVRHQMSFERSNLIYAVRKVEDKASKLIQALNAIQGSAVVYVRNRGRTREIATTLSRRGITAINYHAGLTIAQRDEAQKKWLNNQVRVVVATNAFGMGIDKADVRLVVHMDLPDSLEAYFQEAGRAGRDLKKAYALLLYQKRDGILLKQKLENSLPSPSELKQTYHKLGNYCKLALGAGEGAVYDFDLLAFTKAFKLDVLTTVSALKILEQQGFIYLTDSIFRPAMIYLMATRDELYDFALRNPRLEKLIQAILRTHIGSFQEFVYLKERELARLLGISMQDLKQQLEHLQQQKILEFRSQGELPQLIWSQSRQSHEHLQVDWKIFKKRQEIKRNRLTAAIKYAENDNCRSQQLLSYLGEKIETCGKCDICITEKNEKVKNTDRYHPKIISLLQRQALTSKEVIASFLPRHHPYILKAVEHLLREGEIFEDAGQLYLKDKA